MVSTPQGTLTAVPPELVVGTPDGNAGYIPNENYVIVDMASNPIEVKNPPDGFYDFIFYELFVAPDRINMDNVILSISMDGVNYYEVFNWGDNIPDDNTNISTYTPENDNLPIFITDLFGVNPLRTGIVVDVDNVSSNPPPGLYIYLVIEVPPGATNDGTGIDAIQVQEVSIPFP